MERTTGPWSLLRFASVYAGFQGALGAERARKTITERNVRPFPGARILDVGCGPCDILKHLGDVRYVGVDRSNDYIEAARERFSGRGDFYCADVADLPISPESRFDIVLAFGLLHHLVDDDVDGLFDAIALRLAPGGRLVTLDPVFESPQNPIARFLVSMDRGQNVRTAKEYVALHSRCYTDVVSTVHRDLIRVPYSHLVVESGRPQMAKVQPAEVRV